MGIVLGLLCYLIYGATVQSNWNHEHYGKLIAVFGFAPILIIGTLFIWLV